MNVLEFSGLNATSVAPVVNELSQLLADFQVYYTNLRGFHWNVQGKAFYSFHETFEGFYDEVSDKVDEIAERILQLGATPEHRFSEYLKITNVPETGVVACGIEGFNNVLETLKVLISQERKVLAAAQNANDEVTAALMGDYLRAQEKQVWMLVASLSKRHHHEGCK